MKAKLLKSYKLLIIIPLIVTLLSLGILLTHGLEESVDLKGGSIAE
ncbi:MAG TPA: protein translocase subunit SecF, partial [Methanobacteriales archaeon]|nr:protein translocase subunit SecF [Methanobacteriales archaeon]